MVDIQCPTAEIRRGNKKKKEETTGWNYICPHPAVQGGHKKISQDVHWSNDDCLEGEREDCQVCFVLHCVRLSCTVQCTHIWTDLMVVCWLDLAFLWLYCVLQSISVRLSFLGLIMAALRSKCGHYIFVLWFLVSSSICIFFISSPNLSRHRLDIYHRCTHGVALVQIRMQGWNVLHAAPWKYRTQKIAKNLTSGHHRTALSGYIFATKARIDNWRKTC